MSNDFTPSEFIAWIGHTADYLEHEYDGSKIIGRLRSRLAESIQENFRDTHTPSGETWLPVKRPVPPPPLVKTGDMKLAAIEVAYHVVSGGPSLIYDTSLLPSYWLYQQYGTSVIPAREFIGFPDDFLDYAADLVADDAIDLLQPPR